MYKEDSITETALRIIEETDDVLETKEIEEKIFVTIKDITRTKLFARLNNLRGNGLIKGKFVGPGKGVWIWWRKDAFLKNENSEEKNKRGKKNES
jgi:hypothetical protein